MTKQERLNAFIKVQKPTINKIKAWTTESSPYFFNPDTLRFFHQTMSSFTVIKYGFNLWKITAPRPHGTTEKMFSFTDFNQGKLSRVKEQLL